MPRTSYALKAAGLSIALMLVAAPPADSGAVLSPLHPSDIVLATGTGVHGGTVWVLDRHLRTLRSAPLPAGANQEAAVSPDGARVAISTGYGTGARLYVLRLRDMRVLRTRTLEGDSWGPFAWPRKSTLYGVGHGFPNGSERLVEFDAASLRTRRTWPLRGHAVETGAAGGSVYVVTDHRADGVHVLRIDGRGKVGRRRLPLARTVEPWRSRPGARLPRHAREAAALARAYASMERVVAPREVRVSAIQVAFPNLCFGTIDSFTDHLPGYEVHVEVRGEEWVYAYGFDSYSLAKRTVPCWGGHGIRAEGRLRHDPSRDLFSIGPGIWQAGAFGVAPDPARRRLMVAAQGSPILELDLPSLAVRPQRARLAARRWRHHGVTWPGAALDERRLAVDTGDRVLLVDRRTGRLRQLGRGQLIGAARGRVLVEHADASFGIYDREGRRVARIRVPISSGESYHPTIGCDGVAFVARSHGDRLRLTPIDIARGRRLPTRLLPRDARLLPAASPAC